MGEIDWRDYFREYVWDSVEDQTDFGLAFEGWRSDNAEWIAEKELEQMELNKDLQYLKSGKGFI